MPKPKTPEQLRDRTYPFSIQESCVYGRFEVVDLRQPTGKHSETGSRLFTPVAHGCTEYRAKQIARMLNLDRDSRLMILRINRAMKARKVSERPLL